MMSVEATICSRVFPGLDLRTNVLEQRAKVVRVVLKVGTAAGHLVLGARVAEDVDRVPGELPGDLLKDDDPVDDRGAVGAIDHRVCPVEHQVSHVSRDHTGGRPLLCEGTPSDFRVSFRTSLARRIHGGLPYMA